MKRKLLALALVCLTALSLWTPALAADGFPPADSENWTNLDGDQVKEVFSSMTQGTRKENAIFVYYSHSCGYSRLYVPEFLAYAQEHGLRLLGYDENNEGLNFNQFSVLDVRVLTFPMVVAYNGETGALQAAESVHSMEKFQSLLAGAGLIDGDQADVPQEPEDEEPATPAEDEEPAETAPSHGSKPVTPSQRETSAAPSGDQQTLLNRLGLRETGTMTVSDYVDAGEITKGEAVGLLTQLGILNGAPDGSFDPWAFVDRASVAKIFAMMVSGGDVPEVSGTGMFYDVDGHWAERYVVYCAQRDIVSGSTNGCFYPEYGVTGTQAAKMALVLLGYDPVEYGFVNDPQWEENVDIAAEAAGLWDNVDGDHNGYLDRENTAQLIYNALNAVPID